MSAGLCTGVRFDCTFKVASLITQCLDIVLKDVIITSYFITVSLKALFFFFYGGYKHAILPQMSFLKVEVL